VVDQEDQEENFTVIEASEDADLVAELSEVTEDSTVIEVPVAYTELQTADTQPFVVDQREEEAEDDSDDDEDADDPDFDPDDDDEDFDPESEGMPAKKIKMEQHSIEVEKCSICGATVADLAIHIVNIHSGTNQTSLKKVSPVTVREKREGSPVGLMAGRPRKRAYCKGKYQQIKPVLRYPCDACKHVSKTSEQLKKHMIVSHKGNKATAWMFCGECEYATRVEEELVNHVKMHQVFRLLKDDMAEREEDDEDEDEEEEEVAAVKSTTGLGNYDPNPMNCGDCEFETHYENELFEHLKMHLRKDANIPEDTENEVEKKKGIISAQVEQRTIYEEDDCLHCGLCSFSSKSKKNMLRHSNISHGVVINDKDYQGGTTITVKQTAYHCTLCKFKGTTREELAQHRKRTIHNKYGGVTAVDPIAEAEERKARIRNNCL